MMSFRFLWTAQSFFRVVAVSCILAGATALPANDRATEEKLLGSGLSAWRAGDSATARKHLDELIARGTSDARVYYYRGILDEQGGRDGAEDFRMAAKLEVESSSTTLVNRALERTQGTLRAKIERFRTDAKNALKADPRAANLKRIYREGLEARAEGNLPLAIAKLEQTTQAGDDPRYFYMYGVSLAENGDHDAARVAFSEALQRESTLQDTQLVNIALSGVQGEIRRMIEEQTTLQLGDQLVTRQSNLRDIQRRAFMSQDELLAEASAAGQAAAERARMAAEARRQSAAESIAAQNKAREDREKLVAARPDVPAVTVPADTQPVVPEPTTANTPAASSERPAASLNPFLGGGGAGTRPASTVTAGPIDMSWLPSNTEYLMYARPADLLGSPFLGPLTEMPEFADAMAGMSLQAGFNPADIESVTAGLGNVMVALLPMIAQVSSGQAPDNAALMQQLMGGQNFVAVIRLLVDVDPSELAEAGGGVASTHDGKTYYLMPAQEPQPPMAIYPADARVFVIGSEAAIRNAITSGPGEATNSQFAFLSRTSHIVQAFASPLLAGMSGSIPDPQGAPPQVSQFLQIVKGKIGGVAIVIDARRDLTLNVSLNLTEDAAAAQGNQVLTPSLMMMKQMAPLGLAQAPPELQPLLLQAAQSLSSMNRGSLLSVSLNIPGGIIPVLKNNPQLLGPLFAAQAAASAANQRNNLKQIGLAMHNYHDVYGHFPAADSNGAAAPNRKSGLSWRVYLLPFLGEAELFEMFNLDEPWDSPNNRIMIPLMPDVYAVEGVDAPGETTVHVFEGPGTPLGSGNTPSIRSIIDGTSNTILAVVAGPDTATPWTQPGGLPFSSQQPLGALGQLSDSIEVLFADGSVRAISALINPTTFGLLIQHQDGQIVPEF